MIELTHDTSFKFYQAAEATSILNHLINSENITSSSSCGRQTRWHPLPHQSPYSCRAACLAASSLHCITNRPENEPVTHVPKLHVCALIQNDWRWKTLLHRAGFNPTVPISYLEFPLLSHEFYSVAVLEAPSPPTPPHKRPWILHLVKVIPFLLSLLIIRPPTQTQAAQRHKGANAVL